MGIGKGKGSNAKMIRYRLYPQEGEEKLYSLTARQIGALLSSMEGLNWINRHVYLPDDINNQEMLNDWRDDLHYRLMNPVSDAPMTTCEMIIDCITSNPATQEAIAAMLSGNEVFQQYIYNQTINNYGLSTNQIKAKIISNDCDDALVAGKMLAIVNRMHATNIDFFEAVEIGTNDEEKIATIVGAVPVLGELPIDEVIDYAQDILEDFSENYDGSVTINRLEDWARDLYCIAIKKPDCSITFEDIFNYFAKKTGDNLNILSTALDVIDFIKDGDFNNDAQIANAMMMLQAAFLKTSKSFNGLELFVLTYVTRDAEPSSIWLEAECSTYITDWVYLDPDTYNDWQEIEGTVEYLGGTRYRATVPNNGYDYSMVLAIKSEDTYQNFIISNAIVVSGILPQGGSITQPNALTFWYTAWQLGYGPQVIEFDAVLE